MGFRREVETPNIQGSFRLRRYVNLGGETGAIRTVFSTDVDLVSSTASEEGQSIDYFFEASKSNALYSGNSLQSNALQVLPCIRC